MKRNLDALVCWQRGIAHHAVEVQANEPTDTVRIYEKRLKATIDLSMSELHDLIQEALYE